MPSVKARDKMISFYINEVEKAVINIGKDIDRAIAQQKKAYLGSSNHVVGLTVPQQRQLLKTGYSFSKLPVAEQLIVWDAIWRYSKYHESKAQALLWLSSIKETATLIKFWPIINKWVKKC